MHQRFMAPPGEQFRWLTIERSDGSVQHCPYAWPTETELVALPPERVKELEEERNANLWLWAEAIENGELDGAKVVRIIDDWTGTMKDYVAKVQENEIPPNKV
jgi:hypothetical protein